MRSSASAPRESWGAVVGLGKAEAQIEIAVEPLPEARLDRRQAHHGATIQGPGLLLADHLQLSLLLGRGQGTEVAFAGPGLDVEALAGADARDVFPRDPDRVGGSGLEDELAALELLDLAGEPVAVLEHDDVGLLGGERSRLDQEHGPRQTDGEPGNQSVIGHLVTDPCRPGAAEDFIARYCQLVYVEAS